MEVLFLNTVRDSICREENISLKTRTKLGPVGSTVRYEMMKLCIYWVSIGHYEAVAVGNL